MQKTLSPTVIILILILAAVTVLTVIIIFFPFFGSLRGGSIDGVWWSESTADSGVEFPLMPYEEVYALEAKSDGNLSIYGINKKYDGSYAKFTEYDGIGTAYLAYVPVMFDDAVRIIVDGDILLINLQNSDDEDSYILFRKDEELSAAYDLSSYGLHTPSEEAAVAALTGEWKQTLAVIEGMETELELNELYTIDFKPDGRTLTYYFTYTPKEYMNGVYRADGETVILSLPDLTEEPIYGRLSGDTLTLDLTEYLGAGETETLYVFHKD